MEKKTIKYLQLPFEFDEEKMVSDLKIALAESWSPILNKQDYDGDWNSIALYAPNGDASNVAAHGNTEVEIFPTKILEKCSYLSEVIDSFKTTILTARLLKLSVGSVIKPHRDYQMGYENGNCRIHIPITTNDKVTFILGGEKIKLIPGECWYINANYTHSLSNYGTTDRVHLIIDLEQNQWTDDLFFSLAPKEDFGISDKMDKKVIQAIILNLIEMNNPDNKELIEHYKGLLNS